MVYEEKDYRSAARLIVACERDLGRQLSRGEQRDLLIDNTDWRSDKVDTIVDALNPDGIHVAILTGMRGIPL
jgi:hypothetical protein